MKKQFTLLLFCISILFISQNLYSQSGWVIQNTGSNQFLQSIYVVDSSYCYVTGDSGTFLKTTNGGLNWLSLNYEAMNDLMSVYFFDRNNGIISCNHSTILKTSNGGLNWNVIYLNFDYQLDYLQFFGTETGYMLGSGYCGPYHFPCCTIYKTLNRGENWIISTPDPGYGLSHDMYFININTGFIGYNYWVLRTNDGAYSWSSFYLPNSYWANIFFNFINLNTGWVSTYNSIPSKILKTTNGGNNWTVVCENSSINFGDGYFVNSNIGYSIGNVNSSNVGVILKTYNSGFNWISQFQIYNKYLNRITFINENTGFAIGSNGLIVKTTNGGEPIGVGKNFSNIPNTFSLSQNYPNPFNPTTKVRFDLPKSSFTKLILYDILGREVATLVNEQLKSGTYEYEWDGSYFASGIYFYKLETESFSQTRKMVLIK